MGDPDLRHLNASVGHAASKDVRHWRKHPKNPLIEADPRYYGQRDEGVVGCERMWRDPWVFRHPRTGVYHALVTARAIEGPPDGRGVIGHARSSGLFRWETLPPLTKPGQFYALEVPQLVRIGAYHYLLFSTWAEAHSAARREETRLEPVGGTHYLVADDPLGPFRFSTHDFLVGDPVGSLYSGKLVEGPDGRLRFLAWRNFAPDGAFVGGLADPLPVAVDDAGNLSVARPDAESKGSSIIPEGS